jgi:pimeloyl-ACP methyl ester carboxylesterase
MERPLFFDRKDSPTFAYSFKLYPGYDAMSPTVIFLPGGPGATSIGPGVMRGTLLPQIPPEVSVLATDSRGSGCNAAPSAETYPDAFYDARASAGDILAIIEQLQLEHYVIYGIAEGSVIGTIVASRAEAKNMAPRALVLEGAIGAAWSGERPGVEVAFREGWQRTLAGVSDAVRTQLTAEPLPLHWSGEQWGALVQSLLPRGALPSSGMTIELQSVLSKLEDSADLDALARSLAPLTATRHDALAEGSRHALGCHELYETDVVTAARARGARGRERGLSGHRPRSTLRRPRLANPDAHLLLERHRRSRHAAVASRSALRGPDPGDAQARAREARRAHTARRQPRERRSLSVAAVGSDRPR